MGQPSSVWLIQIEDSRFAKKLRIVCAAFFVVVAVALTLWVSPLGGGTAWWGEWVWVWPLILFGCWQLVQGRAPILPAQSLRLNECGEVPGFQISEPLITPHWLALKLVANPSSTARVPMQVADASGNGGWQWIFSDQVSAQSWARLRRVCRTVKQRGG